MNGLPESFSGEQFVGRELQHVDVCSNQLMFSFDGDCMITLMSSYEVRGGDLPNQTERVPVPVFSKNLMLLLDRVIVAVEATNDGTCTFNFEGGHSLSIHDDVGPYEAYCLAWADGGVRV
jgi:hypothetical protein